jgi:hypothetical protein
VTKQVATTPSPTPANFSSARRNVPFGSIMTIVTMMHAMAAY